jgi:hypothetical protein
VNQSDGLTIGNEGRLELFHNDLWGSVCHEGFDKEGNKARNVACGMLDLDKESGISKTVDTS